MFRNYIKIAWRNIVKSRFYTAITVIGLATGIAFTLIIAAYVWGELQVNRNLKNIAQQYVIQSRWKNPGEGFEIATLGPLAKTLKEDYPSLVKNYYRFDGITSNIYKKDKSFRESIQIGDSTLLNMYGFRLIAGDASTALTQPFTIVITEPAAQKYFGKTNIVGQTLTLENFSGAKHDFQITGVLNRYAKNSVTQLSEDYPSDFFISNDNLDFFNREMSWQNPSIANYIELQHGVSAKDLEQPIAQIMKRDAPTKFQEDLTPYLVPLKTYYLDQNNGVVRKMIYALSAVALFILGMAVINFINMSVSRSSARMKEIGIRKVLGGIKKQLVIQFLTESVIIVLLATVAAFTVYLLTKSFFSNLLGKNIPSLSDFPVYYILYPILFIFFVGMGAGLYPAFVLASLKSVESLKGKSGSVKDNVLLRKGLVVFQFITATVAFVGAIVISKQVNFFLSKKLGYNKDYIISAQVPRDWSQAGVDKMIATRNQFKMLPGIKDVSLSYEVPDGNNAGQAYIYRQGTDTAKALPMQFLSSDEQFINLYQISLTGGTGFLGNRLDSGKIIMNETAIRSLGFNTSEDALGQQVRFLGDPTIFEITGITNDFHFGSMQQKVQPVIIANVQFSQIYRYLSFKLAPGNLSSDIDVLQKKWSTLLGKAPFEYKFMDDTLANLYKSEIQLKKAAYVATILALIIVLLGVIGLISLSIRHRTKEIGIRKVLGSSVTGILILFIRDFLVIVLIGGLIACPVAYLIMSNWLEDYAYRITLTSTPFIISVTCLAFVTIAIIGLQSIKTALTNPVKSLRTE
ncbi:FtsX-like permease family protein [Niabella yanshanensis]|uniref:FtsX-like permease family protein n=1 Tax=Niabella yanshanensis TaxID=577386 RepID=A0ABZ0W4V0_9BACT|nr:ABC transporter permease [Niabella yanshanensis]WQD38285.1 FtsX-like permease family protein [Niabella yanshanensis]